VTGADVRRELGHPILDADGHLLEVGRAAYPFLREHLTARQFERFAAEGSPIANGLAYRPVAERRRTRAPQSAWWGQHTRNALDRATAMFPALLAERLPEVGIDFGVFYTTSAMTFLAIEDEELRRGLCGGWNAFLADLGSPFTHRLALAGLIPMHTPEEAATELRHCHALGLKVAAFPEGVLRPIPDPSPARWSPFLWPGQTDWYDTFGLDSDHDYDPVWATAAELGYAVTFHGGLGLKPGVWTSISNYSANHIGVFGQLMNPVCKGLFFGGATRRFPDLAFAFLECGVSWAAQMLADVVEHWEKRRLDALAAYDPANLDRAALVDYCRRYGGRILDLAGGWEPEELVASLAGGAAPDQLDDWEHLGVTSEAELVEAFVASFYFGCEADDRGVASAFSPANPGGAALRPIFSSDIGHWDVADIAGVVGESFGLVRDGVLSSEQYRSFMFENAARMYLAANPAFFDGTALEAAARPLVGQPAQSQPAQTQPART